MATVAISKLISLDMQDKIVSRIKLPTWQDNPLLVNGFNHSSSISVEAYKSLRTQVVKAQTSREMVTVAIASTAHGDGKTLTSFNLACCCAKLDKISVLLVDGDLRTCGLTKLIPNLPGIGLAQLLEGSKSYEDVVIGTDLQNLHIIGAGKSELSPAELFAGERWPHFMRWAREQFKLVLIDALPVRAVADFDLIAAECDGVVLVVRALKTPREGLEDTLSHLDSSKLVGVVWNGSQKPPAYYSYPVGPKK